MTLPLVARITGLSAVILILEASRAVVLSDISTAAPGWAGELGLAFGRREVPDRDPPRAMRPASFLADRKLFVAAELFTDACGEFPGTLLAVG